MRGLAAQTLVLMIAGALILLLALDTAMGLEAPVEREACNMWEYIASMIPLVRHLVGSC